MNALNSMHFPDDDSREETHLAGNLTALADYRMPPSAVDVEAAIGAGRRRVRQRRGGTALATAAVVAVAAVAAWGAGAADRGDHSTTALASSSPGHGSDPMTPQLAFGYLPGPATGGFGWTESTMGSNIDVENGTVNVSAMLLRPGAPEPGGPYTDGGTVNGHPAVWASGVAIQPVLAWHYKPDAWAYVLAEGANDAQTHKIAETLRIGPQPPIPLPMHLAALPHGFTVSGGSATGTTATKPNSGGGFSLCYRGDCDMNGLSIIAYADFHLTLPRGSSSVVVQPSGGSLGKITQLPGSPIFETITIDGLTVMAHADGTAAQAIGGESGLTAFLKSMTWYGTDPAKWTTDVIG